jgi:TetR/AcrR family transcriptional repressor of nem operon
MRRQGYVATTVSDFCRAAGVTKYAFFHRFPTKYALAVADAQEWTAHSERLIFTDAPRRRFEDPLDRHIAHIDFRLATIDGPVEGFSCFVGTMALEAYATSEGIRPACEANITAFAARLAADIAAARERNGIRGGVITLDLTYHAHTIPQGALVMAQAKATRQSRATRSRF